VTATTSTIVAYIVIGVLLWGYATHLLVSLVKAQRRAKATSET
jgi:hypothetical protein